MFGRCFACCRGGAKHKIGYYEGAPEAAAASLDTRRPSQTSEDSLDLLDAAKDFTDLDRLRELVTGRDLVLVKGSYLMELAAAGEILPRRQDLPDHAVCDARMLDRALAELSALKDILGHALLEAHFPGLVVVSYAWATKEHPDPECQMLREVIAPALEWYLSERAAYLQRGGFDGKGAAGNKKKKGWSQGRSLESLDSVDVCVFLDYPSMYQKPRDEEQDEAFRRALNSMEVLYAHQLTVKLRATRHLTSMQGLRYDDRGWPCFETRVSTLISGAYGVFDLGNVDWTQPLRYPVCKWDKENFKGHTPTVETDNFVELKFDGVIKPVTELAKQASYHYRNETTGIAKILKAGRAVPMLPHMFEEEVKKKKFTNDADHEAVMAMYNNLCRRVLQHVTRMDYSNMGWSAKDAPAVADVLVACPKIKHIELYNNPWGPEGVTAFAEAFAKRDLSEITFLGFDCSGACDVGVLAFCRLIQEGRLPALVRMRFGEQHLGAAAWNALAEIAVARPDLMVHTSHCTEDSEALEARRLYKEAVESTAIEKGYKPQPACKDAPKMVLVRLGEGTGRELVFEYAAALAKGEQAPLTLASHPGKAITPHAEKPRRSPTGEWSLIGLGVGSAEAAVVAQFDGEFITRVSDDRVFDVSRWDFRADNHMWLIRSIANHPEKTRLRHRTIPGPGGRSFTMTADGHFALTKDPSFVLGIACMPAGVAST